MNSSQSSFRTVALVVACCLATGLSSYAAAGDRPLAVTVDANSIAIHAAGTPLLKYRYSDVPFKPYVRELFTPGGLNVLLDAPHDHLHHHGLMYAVAVDGVNFWEETPAAGRQVEGPAPQVVIAQHGGGPSAGFIVGPVWLDATGRKGELAERRTVEVCQAGILGATVVVWRSDLSVPKAKQSVTLSGSHYFGLGMRFVRAMDGGEFFNADGREGTVFRGEERLVQSSWCAYTAAIDGKPVTVAMLGHPDNPRHPTMWFTMAKPFAYLSATLNLHERPLTLSAGERLVLRYAIVAWDGKVSKDRVNQAYQWFVGDYSQGPKTVEGVTQDGTDR
ncbi:MAG: PmoA family protein [Sedimentisphaerales bacterium]|nr:PmoA family protein [Sedimentisphaerales bacterium]